MDSHDHRTDVTTTCTLAVLMSTLTCFLWAQVLMTSVWASLLDGPLGERTPYAVALAGIVGIGVSVWLLSATVSTWQRGETSALFAPVKTELALCGLCALTWLISIEGTSQVPVLALMVALALCFGWLLRLAYVGEPPQRRRARQEKARGTGVWD